MAGRFKTAFFAFPSEPNDLFATIVSAAKTAANASNKLSIRTWPELEVFGAALADEVRNEIRAANVLICDITRPNPNVYYEIGFAIGLGKPIAPVINRAFGNSVKDVLSDGFFDGVGFKSYENSEQLAQNMVELPNHILVDLYGKSPNFQQPLYLLDTFRKTDFRNAIVSAVKESKVFFRSFDPVETPASRPFRQLRRLPHPLESLFRCWLRMLTIRFGTICEPRTWLALATGSIARPCYCKKTLALFLSITATSYFPCRERRISKTV